MAIYLLYRTDETDRNSNGVHAALVDAADEATARTAAQAAAPTGETYIPAGWAAAQIAASGALPQGQTVLFFEGDCCPIGGKGRGL